MNLLFARSRSLQRKLLTPMLAGGAIVAILVLGAIYYSHQQQLENRIGRRGELVANMINYVAEGISRRGELQRIVTSIAAERDILDILVVGDHPPRVLASSDSSYSKKLLSEFPRGALRAQLESVLNNRSNNSYFDEGSKSLNFAVPMLLSHEKVFHGEDEAVVDAHLDLGVVMVRLDTRPLRLEIAQSTLMFSIAFMLILLLGLVVVYRLLAKSVLKPVDAIGHMVERSDFSSESDWRVADTGDEIGQLARVLRGAMTALKDQSQQTRAILDYIVDGIVIMDTESIIESVNPAVIKIFGYTEKELIGQNVNMLMPSPYRENHDRYVNNYHLTGHARIIGIGREVEGMRKDGSVFPLDLAISKVNRQNHIFYIGVVRDITERKRIAKMQSEFVSTVSHELRTPLTVIGGTLSMVLQNVLGDVPDKMRELLEVAQKNVQRLGLLINDLLDMEKISSGSFKVEIQLQPLLPLVQQSVELNRAYGAGRAVSIDLLPSAENQGVRVDGPRVIQVISNFISNAVKFSPRDSAVVVDVKKMDEWVRVSVTDHGPGIPEEFKLRIFQKFAQADASDAREKGGTGLGLAISKALIERMGGRVGFTSEVGKGSCFYFDLPLIAV